MPTMLAIVRTRRPTPLPTRQCRSQDRQASRHDHLSRQAARGRVGDQQVVERSSAKAALARARERGPFRELLPFDVGGRQRLERATLLET